MCSYKIFVLRFSFSKNHITKIGWACILSFKRGETYIYIIYIDNRLARYLKMSLTNGSVCLRSNIYNIKTYRIKKNFSIEIYIIYIYLCECLRDYNSTSAAESFDRKKKLRDFRQTDSAHK